jgi:circadian clock protein KaiC
LNTINENVLATIASSKYGFNIDELTIKADVSIKGISGMEENFDYTISSGDNIIAVKLGNSENTANDIMIFNSKSQDAGITKKLLLTDSELNSYIVKLCNVYGIIIVDIREYGITSNNLSKFGIDIFDEKLSGGLRPGYVYMISGISGSGRTILSSIFLSYGAKVGEKGLMILTDIFPDQFINNMKTMNIGFDEGYKKGMIEVMEISSQIRSMKSEISSGKSDFRKFITKVVSEFKKIIISKNIKRVVIDTVTLLLIPDDDYINLFINSLAIDGVTILVISGLRNSELSVFGIEEYYVTGIIKLDYTQKPEGISRTARIVKMRGIAFDGTPIHFKITENGIERDESNDNVLSFH